MMPVLDVRAPMAAALVPPPPSKAGFAGWAVHHRRGIVAAWVAALAVLGPAAARVEQVLDVSGRVENSESSAVDEMLRTRFASPFARYAVLVLTGIPRPDSDSGSVVLEGIVADVRAVHGVTGTISWLDAHDSLFVPKNGGGTFVIVGIGPTGGAADAMVPLLRDATAGVVERLRDRHPGIALRWSGDVALNYDIRRASAAEGQKAERRALPLTLAMLLVAFGTLAAAFLSIAAGVVGIVASLGVAAIVAAHWPLSILLSNIVSMIGLGLGIDYALLTVSRFREELDDGRDPLDAAVRAARIAGHTILLSGCAVLIGFLALALVPLSDLRSVAVGGALVVAFSVLVAVTLLPALLAMLGARVNSGRLWRRSTPTGGPNERWRRWGRWVAAHPVAVLIVAGAPVVFLAAQVRRIDTGLPRSGWLPPAMESARALTDLTAMDRGGVVQALRVVVELPAGTSALEGDGWRAVARIGRALAADPRIERVQSLPLLVGSDEPNLMLTSLVPADVRSTFVSGDQRAAVLELLPRSAADFPAVTQLVRDLRASDIAAGAKLPGTRISVGGMPAFNADYEDAITKRMPMVIGLVLGGTLLALLVGFRSVLIPLKALALNLLSVAAALGAVVLVFQDGYGARLVGLDGGMGSLFPALPALVFCIVFGLSMDYEVFLVARVREAREGGADDVEAIADGLARTGGVITSAAAIMIVVFAAFMLGDFLMIKVLGFALATAVLLDATLVRMAIGPALLRLAGRWNWWPGTTGSAVE
jgi:RND superfamily putative drug exporter